MLCYILQYIIDMYIYALNYNGYINACIDII